VTSIAAWLGARVFRAHNVTETRQALDVVATIKGDRIPSRTTRGPA
jgi:dihydropteroate synthase